MNVGVIGVGVMGFNHARVYSELPDVTLVGVFDADPATAAATAAKLRTTAFSSIDQLYAAGVDAVSIAVPTSLHRELALQAFERGVHVLLEKPIAGTLADAQAIMAAADSTGRKLMIGHIERFNPVIQSIKKIVHRDEIVAINIVRVGPLPPRIKDVGIIVDLGVHDIDIVRFLTEQDVRKIHCVTSSNISQFEDMGSMLLDLGEGVAAMITTNWITPYKSREIQIITKERFLRGNLITQQLREYRSVDSQDESFLVRDITVRRTEPLRSELSAFLDAVRTGTTPPITGADGFEALRLARLALEGSTPAQ